MPLSPHHTLHHHHHHGHHHHRQHHHHRHHRQHQIHLTILVVGIQCELLHGFWRESLVLVELLCDVLRDGLQGLHGRDEAHVLGDGEGGLPSLARGEMQVIRDIDEDECRRISFNVKTCVFLFARDFSKCGWIITNK